MSQSFSEINDERKQVPIGEADPFSSLSWFVLGRRIADEEFVTPPNPLPHREWPQSFADAKAADAFQDRYKRREFGMFVRETGRARASFIAGYIVGWEESVGAEV